eukprot:TRINITY_DN4113_c0_g1_i1.p1 TRINITY_DN4113_c0_g1~~TRINITY_DN4113_c0_g1_i1.p1  ORF type:complete len:200 (+),score=31.57 TRINITY_DN4113_c0_g1_i1:217-816(+)
MTGESRIRPSPSKPVATKNLLFSVSNKPAVLLPDTVYTAWFQLTPSFIGDINLGLLNVQWCRPSKDETPAPTLWQFSLPKVSIHQTPFHVAMETPDHGVIGDALTHRIVITNNTNVLQDFSLSVNENQSFLVAGDKKTHFRVNPKNRCVVEHRLLPMSVGRIAYPVFELRALKFDKVLPITQQERFVFIKPYPNTPILV